MDIHVRLHGFGERGRTVQVPPGATVGEMLRSMDVPREAVLVFRGDVSVPDTEAVEEGETLRVLRIVSGGALRSAPQPSLRP